MRTVHDIIGRHKAALDRFWTDIGKVGDLEGQPGQTRAERTAAASGRAESRAWQVLCETVPETVAELAAYTSHLALVVTRWDHADDEINREAFDALRRANASVLNIDTALGLESAPQRISNQDPALNPASHHAPLP